MNPFNDILKFLTHDKFIWTLIFVVVLIVLAHLIVLSVKKGKFDYEQKLLWIFQMKKLFMVFFIPGIDAMELSNQYEGRGINIFIVRIPAPSTRKGRIEQTIVRDYVS